MHVQSEEFCTQMLTSFQISVVTLLTQGFSLSARSRICTRVMKNSEIALAREALMQSAPVGSLAGDLVTLQVMWRELKFNGGGLQK
jgi:hypothetical protein